MANESPIISALKVIGAIVIPGGFIVGSVYLGNQVRNFKKIDYKVYGFKIKNIGGGVIDLILSLEIHNPSAINLDVNGYSFDATVNGIKAAAINSDAKRTLLKRSKSILDIPITIKFAELINKTDWAKIIESYITGNTDKIFVNLDGYISGSVAKIPITRKIGVSASVKDLVQKNEPKIKISK